MLHADPETGLMSQLDLSSYFHVWSVYTQREGPFT